MSRVVISPEPGTYDVSPVTGTPFMTGGGRKIDVSECFCEAFQGEGAYTGVPAVFLRLSGCRLGCRWCDTRSVWTVRKTFSIGSLTDIFVNEGLAELLDKGHHLVVTGGSPLLQQDSLHAFLKMLSGVCREKPFVEIENECSVMVSGACSGLFGLVRCWNCSPKLGDSGVPERLRYNKEAVRQVVENAEESWFKFVVSSQNIEQDWNEIDRLFLRPGLVGPEKIILMPQGACRAELTPEVCRTVAEFAVSRNVRYGDRLHINLYDTRKSV